MAIQKVCILGHTWNVWSELVSQISRLDWKWHRHINPTSVVWLVNKGKYLLDERWIKNPELLIDRQVFGENANKFDKLHDIYEQLMELWLDQEVVFVDVTAEKWQEMSDFHWLVVQNRNRLVTANKNPLSLWWMDEFQRLTCHRDLYRFNASVMAWWDGVPLLQDSYDLQDPIQSIEWCFSWTLWYICSELQEWKKFSEIVKKAKEEWYTEPNPWDDLNWLDVARKLIILARCAWFEAELSDIDIDPFINPEYWKITNIEDFLESMKELDEHFERMVFEANKKNEVIRYVWNVQRNELWLRALNYGHSVQEPWKNGKNFKIKVSLKSVPKDSPLWWLKWTANFIKIVSRDMYPESNPHIIQTPWAWLARTAAAVRKDLLKFVPDRVAVLRNILQAYNFNEK